MNSHTRSRWPRTSVNQRPSRQTEGSFARNGCEINGIVLQIEQVAIAILRDIQDGGAGSNIGLDSLATLLAIRLLPHRPAASAFSPPASGIVHDAAVRSAIEFIEEHLSEDLPLVRVASAANFSPYHFTRLFRRTVGISPHQYIIQRRVERAKHLLSATEWNLSYIAREAGFAGGSHLGLHFKRHTGRSPREYRSHHVNGHGARPHPDLPAYTFSSVDSNAVDPPSNVWS